eukprot:1979354-Rhodomonas_salina.4
MKGKTCLTWSCRCYARVQSASQYWLSCHTRSLPLDALTLNLSLDRLSDLALGVYPLTFLHPIDSTLMPHCPPPSPDSTRSPSRFPAPSKPG